eukprot:m.384862 g.384862  ORF g.384862 m.384862 type:complete len:270 (+) comp56276_c1_seq19:977-1786(+)
MDFRGDDLDGLLFRQNPPRAAVYSRLSGLWPTDWPSTLLACFARQSGLYEASLITFFCLLALVQDAQILQGLDVSAVIDSPQEWTTQIRGAHVIHSADVAAALAALRNGSVDAMAADTLASGLIATVFGENVFRSSGALEAPDDINIMVSPLTAILPAIHPWTGASIPLRDCISLVLARSGYDILDFFRFVKTDFPSNDESFAQAEERSADVLLRFEMQVVVPIFAFALVVLGWIYFYIIRVKLNLPAFGVSAAWMRRILARAALHEDH